MEAANVEHPEIIAGLRTRESSIVSYLIIKLGTDQSHRVDEPGRRKFPQCRKGRGFNRWSVSQLL